MSDISMLWWHIGEEMVTAADLDEIRTVCHRLGIPPVVTREQKMRPFKKAATATVSYVDDEGVTRVITGQIGRSSDEFTSCIVARDDGLKMAEWKFFASRRTSTGLVPGSHTIRSVIRAGLPDTDRAAVERWLAQAEQSYDPDLRTSAYNGVRRQVRDFVLSAAIPVLGRDGIYFLYDDEIEIAHQAGRLLEALTKPAQWWLVSIADDSDYSVFAQSADAHLNVRLSEVVQTLQLAVFAGRRVAPGHYSRYVRDVEWTRRQHARHARRLSLSLPQTEASLLLADEILPHVIR